MMNSKVIVFLLIIKIFIAVFLNALKSLIPRRLKKQKSIKGKTVLITGAGSGLGRALAIEFSKYETCVILVDINKQAMHKTKELMDQRSSAFIYQCDVTDCNKVCEMADKIKIQAGDVNILVNNAGVVSGKFLWNLSEENIRKTMEVNVIAHFWTCKAFLPAMMNKNEGHIVSIVSIAGKSGSIRVTDYCASKFAAVGLAESLQLELWHKKLNGIKVTVVCPSVIDTGLFEGAKFRIADLLTAENVAKEVITGILEEEGTLFVPRYLKFFFKIHLLLPREAQAIVSQIAGIFEGMDNFVGRT